MKIHIKKPKEIELMRKTCQLAGAVLKYIDPYVKPGVSTQELNDLCHDYILSQGATPTPLNYKGFPKSICTSINEVVCHGIPHKEQILKEGDIVNVDITVFKHQFHGDTSKTYIVGGTQDLAVQNLVERTQKALWQGIEAVCAKVPFSVIGQAIEAYIEPFGYGIVREYCGHGIGRRFHEDPSIMHFSNDFDVLMQAGMIFTIEPMINLGGPGVELMKDGWTVLTRDRKWSAQFEHTILVTEKGFEVLTLY